MVHLHTMSSSQGCRNSPNKTTCSGGPWSWPLLKPPRPPPRPNPPLPPPPLKLPPPPPRKWLLLPPPRPKPPPRLNPPRPPPRKDMFAPTGATCTSGPGAHTHSPGTSASHEPLRPPYRDKSEQGRESPRTRITGLEKKSQAPAEAGRLSPVRKSLQC